MSTKYILIVHGEPFSIFSEVLGKYFKKKKKFKKKIIIIGNKQLLKKQLKKLKCDFPLNEIDNYLDSKINLINIIDIRFSYKKIFSNISSKSNKYIEDCFKKSLDIIKNSNDFVLINGPISKKTFLSKRYSGITEYLSKKTNSKDEVMLIYNNKLSVSPLSTHIPIKNVTKQVNKDKIVKNLINIDKFYKNILKKKSKVAVLGLNPHCETTDKFSEEDKIIKPSINYLKKRGLNVSGPFSADTFFIKKNLNKYNVVLGMYHDQVLTPIKTLFNFNAINITIGLPFLRISPDHGPNSEMAGKNRSDPSSFFYAMKFAEKIR
tara:strand:- start:264 stop:1223 length:960 start_codon:yes stop_codon:yes gene_type:complete